MKISPVRYEANAEGKLQKAKVAAPRSAIAAAFSKKAPCAARLAFAFCLLPFAFFTGCTLIETHPDPSRFYVLDAPVASQDAVKPAAVWPFALAVARVQTPSYLDQPQLVSRASGSRVTFSEFNRWLEPVDKGATRVFAASLASRLGAERVAMDPALDFYRDGVLVQVNALRFDGVIGDTVVLRARWRAASVHDGSALVVGERTVTAKCKEADYQSYAAAMGEALDTFAGLVAEEIRTGVVRGPDGYPVPAKPLAK